MNMLSSLKKHQMLIILFKTVALYGEKGDNK